MKIWGNRLDKKAHAHRLGWKPREDYEGNLEEWVNYDEFLRRRPLSGLNSVPDLVKKLTKEQIKIINNWYK